MNIKFITNEQLYKDSIEPVSKAVSFVWIGTAGIKSACTRNFEAGIVTTDTDLVGAIMKQFDEVWMGKHCKSCKRKEYCTDLIK